LTTNAPPARCRICLQASATTDSVVVPGATLDVQHERFTVYRCSHCGTLNALEPVDYDRVYRQYPIQRQQYDLLSRVMFAKRLRILKRAGLQPGHSVLDYGCGSGHFVRYLLEQGYRCAGFDPYNPRHDDPVVLQQPFDLVTSQDVIEHVDDPAAFLASLMALVAPGGRLVIGTPYAEHVDLHNTIDQLGVLHQPFHRFVMAKSQAQRFFSPPGWQLLQLIDACYIDTALPFANTMFLFHLFESGDGMMDFAFGDIPPMHFVRHPGLLFWGLFGRLFARRQDLFAVMTRQPAASPSP
jgi:SAM-dependent methyltransferase